MFQYDSIEKYLSNDQQNVTKQLKYEWPKLAKEYIIRIDQRINDQVNDDTDRNNVHIDISNSNLAPDLQRRLMLRYLTFNFVYL